MVNLVKVLTDVQWLFCRSRYSQYNDKQFGHISELNKILDRSQESVTSLCPNELQPCALYALLNKIVLRPTFAAVSRLLGLSSKYFMCQV